MVKPRIKISSGGFRTWADTGCFAHVRCLFETAHKQGRDLLDD